MKQKFTLVELVVACGILVLILLVATLTISTVYRTWNSITEHENDLKQFRKIDYVVETAFRNAIPFRWRDRNNKEILMFIGGHDSLFLTYLHRIDDQEDGGIRFLRLALEDEQLVAEYRQRPFMPGVWEDVALEREVLLNGVGEINFIYADNFEQRLEWFEEWDIENKKNLPMAIQMEIIFRNGDKEVWLRRTAGNSQYSE